MFQTKQKLRRIRRRACIHDVNSLNPSIGDIFYEYVKYSKINGLYYLQRDVTCGFTRFLWISIIILITVFGGILTLLVVRAFFEIPTLMTRVTPAPTLQVPFPAMTVCSANTIIDYKAIEFVNHILIPDRSTRDEVKEALLILSAFTERQWSTIQPEDVLLVDKVLKLNNMTILEAVENLGLGCSDFIKRFKWGKKQYACNDKYCEQFTQSVSYLGICCSINYHPLNSTAKPLAINYFGIGSGLGIILSKYPQLSDGISGALNSDGLIMLVHHPQIFPSESTHVTLIKPGRENYIAVYPIITTCASNVLNLSPQERKCIQPADYDGNTYAKPECERECFNTKIYRTCGCHPYYLPMSKKTTVRMCDVGDVVCFAENFWNLKKRNCGHCLPACDEITYRISTFRSVLIPNRSYSIVPIYADLNASNGEFTANIYLARQTVHVQKKILVLSWITLLASFGGIFNLSIGMSAVAVIEFVFYFGAHFIKFYIRKSSRSNRTVELIRSRNSHY